MQKLDCDKIESLIMQIRENPILYDKRERLYRNNEAKDKLWSQIAVKINIPVNDCKSAWKSLRDQYGKYLKESKTVSGQAFEGRKPYKYSGQLEFLKDSMQPRQTTGNYDASEEIDEVFALDTSMETLTNVEYLEVASDSQPSTSRRSRSSTSVRSRSSTPASKRFKATDDEYTRFLQKLIEMNEKSEEKEGPHKFFASLADTVASFNLPPLDRMKLENNVHSYCLQQLSEWQEKNNPK